MFRSLLADRWGAELSQEVGADSERATFGLSTEVKVSLPSAVAGALGNAASMFGVSLETLVVRIIKQGRGAAADDKSDRGE
jgi:hypothetical protein